MAGRRFELGVEAPFRLDLTVWALRRQAHNAIDTWDGELWRRSVGVADGVLEITVRQLGSAARPGLEVAVEGTRTRLGASALEQARGFVTRSLGLDVDLSGFYDLADHDDGIATLAERFVGMRPPRFPSVFETVVNAVACQQLSLVVGIHLLNRLTRRLGSGSREGKDGPPPFPGPVQVAGADPLELRDLGFSGAKARTIVNLGRQVAAGEVDLEGLERLDDATARDRLLVLPGIGRWSAEYTLLRGLGRLEVLPGDDVGARNSLRRRFGWADEPGYDALVELSRRWWPYGGLVYFHLLLDRLAAEGHVEPLLRRR